MKQVVTGLALAVGLLVAVAPSSAAAPPGARHCVQHVVGKRATGQLVLSHPRCYSTYDGALRAEGARTRDGASRVRGIQPKAVWVLGTHYDGGNLNGDSVSVVGDACNAGWINVSLEWDNRISSTAHGCPHIKHFTGGGLTGSWQTTSSPWDNLNAPVNNATSSIQYLP